MNSSNFTHFKPEIEKDEVTIGIDQEEKKKEMVISEGFHFAVTSIDGSSSVLMVDMKKKEEDSQEPISQIQDAIKKNQEPVGNTQLDDSAKEDVCQVHSLTPSMSQYENALGKMMNSESRRIKDKQDEVFQVQDVVTGDQHLILVVEKTTQDDFIKSNSISQNLVELSNRGELTASGSNNERMSAEIGSSRIVSGYGCARKETIDLGKKRAGICSENLRQPRRRFKETNPKKYVLSMFVEARNIFCQKKLDGNKQSYSREEMEALRFENSYQQRQIWREIYTGLGPIVAKQLNQLAEARQNGKAITDKQQQQQQQHYHHQHPRQHQEHHQYSLKHHQYSQQQQQHRQHSKKPPQHHHHQHQLAGVHGENTSILGAGAATGGPVHLRINMKNARTNCYVPYVHYIPVYYSMSH